VGNTAAAEVQAHPDPAMCGLGGMDGSLGSPGCCCCVHAALPEPAAAAAAHTPQNHLGAPPLVAAGTSAVPWARHPQSSTAVGRWWICCLEPEVQRSPRCLHREASMHASPVSLPCQRRLWWYSMPNVLGPSSSAAAAATGLRAPANGLSLGRVVNVHREAQPVLAVAPAAWRCEASMLRMNQRDAGSGASTTLIGGASCTVDLHA
jgi:hypothetical protein